MNLYLYVYIFTWSNSACTYMYTDSSIPGQTVPVWVYTYVFTLINIYLVRQRLFQPCSVARMPESVLLYMNICNSWIYQFAYIIHTHIYIGTYIYTHMMMIWIPPTNSSRQQESVGTDPSGASPPAQPLPPPQTRGTQSHSAPTTLERPMLTWSDSACLSRVASLECQNRYCYIYTSAFTEIPMHVYFTHIYIYVYVG